MEHLYILKDQITEILTKNCTQCWFKVPICFILAALAFFFGAENQNILIALIILIGFDLITGIAAAHFSKEVITSRKALKTATKLFVYAILYSGAYFVEGIIPAETMINDAMISFLALTEFISIMENAGKMGFTVPQKLLNKMYELRGAKS